MAKLKVTKESLIKDLKQVAGQRTAITRHEYLQSTKLGKRYESVFRTFDEFREAAGLEAANQQSESHVIEDDKLTITLPKTAIHTYDELVSKFSIDTKVWEVSRFNATYSNTDESAPYRVVAFLRKRKDILAIHEEIESLRNLASSQAARPKTEYVHKSNRDNMLEINIPDSHFGKLSWPEETGFEPYDIKIASTMYARAVDALIERTAGTKYDQVLYIIGNDQLNADDLEGRTTSGTQVTNDARYHKVFAVVRTTVIQTVEKLRKIAPVKVIVVYGNHDQLSSWHLGDSIQCYFHQYSDVLVDNSPKQRKYHEYGATMLGFTHGDKGSPSDYPLLMAVEQSTMFGRTTFREMHTGHTHKTKLDEKHGVRVRVLPALCPADDWHSEMGYVGNQRNAEAYTWNRREGLTSITIYNDQSQEPIVTEVVLKK